MADNLFEKKDSAPVWFELPNGSKRVFPKHAVAKMLADKNRGWKECEPEFVPKRAIRPSDDQKNSSAMKNFNTEMSGRQLGEIVNSTVADLREYAKKAEVSLTGCTTKKDILEALEKAGKLY